MENKTTTRFLTVSLFLVSIFCILIFSLQTIFMNLMKDDAIRQLGVIYMSGLSEQVAAHFGTTIELRLSQVEGLVDAVPPGRFVDGGTPLQIELAYNARAGGFEYLALYTDDGDFHMVYGQDVTPDIPEALHRTMLSGKYNVCAGKDADGTSVVLMGVPVAYPLDGGGESIALIAGLPTSYLSETLEGSVKSHMVGYSIIRNDGSYVMQDSAIEEDNYFERIANLYETYNGKDPAQYTKELEHALEYDRDYTSEVMILGERWNVYCTSLPHSEWYLLLKISHNTLDDTIILLKERWFLISFFGCCLILGALFLVFLRYFGLTRKQMRALEEARQTAVEAKQSAERSNRAKSEFLSNMSHDIRTPMNGIMGMTSVAISHLDEPFRVRACLKKINISSRHLLGLINDMLDMSKMESGRLTLHMEPVSLCEIMQNITTIIQPQIHEKGQYFNIYIHDVYTENVCADRIRLSQILLNILGNAGKFTPENGHIVVDLYEEPSPKGDGYIRSRLHVGDDGIGMSEEFKGKIFDAFAREDNARVEKTAGAGLGMTITKYIVDAMGGTIDVKSERGKGSDFYVTIDMEKTMQQESEMQLPNLDVLIIDDDETADEVAISLLESIGMHADRALDTGQAVQMEEERESQNGKYHMVLLDWDIQGQDGIQAAKELRSHFGEDVPLLLLSDGEYDELEEAAEEVGVNGFIVKPLFRSSLYYGLRKFAEAVDMQQQEEPEDVGLTGRHILVAEDNDLNWEIAQAMLLEFGMEPDWAENGQICVEKFGQSALGWYDAVLMDLRMPVMNGFEASSAIRKLGRADAGSVPIIAVSADAFAEDVQKCFDCGMNAHTAKPFDIMKIVSLLTEYLQK